jgi:chaperone required for assembly of F1-ATPase
MANGSLDAPYEGASIEAASIAEALQKAKKWAASVRVADNSWLQILLDGRSIRSLKPGLADSLTAGLERLIP